MTQTPIFDAVVEAQGYEPGAVKFLSHKEFMAHHDRLRRTARKAAAAVEKNTGPVRAPVKKKAPAKKTQPKKG